MRRIRPAFAGFADGGGLVPEPGRVLRELRAAQLTASKSYNHGELYPATNKNKRGS